MSEEIGKYHYYEIMDRISVIQDLLEDAVYTHPAMEKHQKHLIDIAQEKLYNVQCWAAGEFDRLDEEEK